MENWQVHLGVGGGADKSFHFIKKTTRYRIEQNVFTLLTSIPPESHTLITSVF
jgi:hypothetical protein